MGKTCEHMGCMEKVEVCKKILVDLRKKMAGSLGLIDCVCRNLLG